MKSEITILGKKQIYSYKSQNNFKTSGFQRFYILLIVKISAVFLIESIAYN